VAHDVAERGKAAGHAAKPRPCVMSRPRTAKPRIIYFFLICCYHSFVDTYVHGEVPIITGPPSFKQHNLVNIQLYMVRHNYRNPSFKWHNLVYIHFIYMKISGNIADGMLSLKI